MTATAGTVLVVDDDPTIRAFLVDALRGEGYPVDAATDGAQAIQLLEQHGPPTVQFGLILLDMMMPRVDGCGVLRYLADLGNSVPVVAMSASPEALSAATVAGAQATLRKPFDLDRLLTLVRNSCHAAQNKA